jgi:ADP-ribose pyrophosphatase
VSRRDQESRSEEFVPLASRTVYDGRVVRLDLDRVRFPDGSEGELEMIRHTGAAAILPLLDPLDAPDPSILLLRQFRYAAADYLYEVPAGRPDSPDEDWVTCARRELEEETGMVAAELVRMTSILTTPGFTDERIHLFLAYDLSEGTISRDRDEFIELVTLPLSAALRMIAEETITDAKTVSTLLFAKHFLLARQ